MTSKHAGYRATICLRCADYRTNWHRTEAGNHFNFKLCYVRRYKLNICILCVRVGINEMYVCCVLEWIIMKFILKFIEDTADKFLIGAMK